MDSLYNYPQLLFIFC